MASAGWYPDPRGGPMQRWFDGVSWTEALLDPSAAVPPAPVAPPARETMAAGYPPAQAYPQPGYPQQYAPQYGQPYRAPSSGFQWWWTVIGVVLSMLVLQIRPNGDNLIQHVDYLEVIAAFFAGAGIGMSRARPVALGIPFGLASAVTYAVLDLVGFHLLREQSLWAYSVALFVAATLAAAIPGMAAAPRALVWLGAPLGAALGAVAFWGYIHYVESGNYDSYNAHVAALAFSLALALAGLGVLALGGRPGSAAAAGAPAGFPSAQPSYQPAQPGYGGPSAPPYQGT